MQIRLQEVSILAGITDTLESVITHYNTFTRCKDVMTWEVVSLFIWYYPLNKRVWQADVNIIYFWSSYLHFGEPAQK